MAEAVQAYVPGYRLKQRVQLKLSRRINRSIYRAWGNSPDENSGLAGSRRRSALSACLCGNLDIMTSSALATAEKMAQSWRARQEKRHER